MSEVISKSDLLSGSLLKRELVEIPGTGKSVYVRELSTEGALAFQKKVKEYKEAGVTETTPEMNIELMALAVSLSVCDEKGNLLLTEEEAKGLSANSMPTLLFLEQKALSISGLERAGEQLTSEVAANLPNAPTSSPSSLPTNSKKRKRK